MEIEHGPIELDQMFFEWRETGAELRERRKAEEERVRRRESVLQCIIDSLRNRAIH